MHIDDMSVVLLAGDPKCLKSIPPSHAESYLSRAVRAVEPLGYPIVLVAHPEVCFEGGPMVTSVPAGAGLFESLAAGFAACQTDHALILATDLPLIHVSAVVDFLQQVNPAQGDAAIALAELQACQQRGHTTHHPIPLAGQRFKFGSAFVVRCATSNQILRTVRDLLALRKQPIRLVQRFLSWRFLIPLLRFTLSHRFLRCSLSFEAVQRIILEQTGLRVQAVIADPVLAIDHDT